MNSRRRIAIGLVTASLVLAGIVVTGCSMDRWVKVEPGVYAIVRELGSTDTAAVREVRRLEVDRDGELIVFTLVNGSQVASSFLSRDRAEWPAGCPTNIQSTRMEVLDIAEDPLSLGSTVFHHPVLVRDCPRNPVRLVLREDGEMGGGGTACPYGEKCLYFAPESTDSAGTKPLPHSAKGYELYSWETDQRWQFALITGSDRLKRYKEIVSGERIPAENIVTGAEWVALTGQGMEELTALLRRLPQGEIVSWRGNGWLERAGVTGGGLRLPGPEVIKEVEAACRDLGIELQVAD
jgi:hypothetical protein